MTARHPPGWLPFPVAMIKYSLREMGLVCISPGDSPSWRRVAAIGD